jgi:hypothetical protein
MPFMTLFARLPIGVYLTPATDFQWWISTQGS